MKIRQVNSKIKVPKFILVLVAIKLSKTKNVREACNLSKLSYSTTIRLIWRMSEQENWLKIKKESNNDYNISFTEKGEEIYKLIIKLYTTMGYIDDNTLIEQMIIAE